MTLDIIVPHYDEPWTEGKKMFDMLALQRDVDFSEFRVILVNDGEQNDVYPEIVKQKYPYAVDEIIIPHKGVSAARNRGIDHSDARWVMFCDFDDTFTSIYSLRMIFDALETERHDMLWFPFYVELNVQQKRQIRKKFNLIFTHGKVYRRSFLNRHQIRFEESLYFSEDAAFNRVVDMEIDQNRIGKIDSEIIPYVWAYRMGSITTDPEKVYSNAIGLFRRQVYVAREHLKRGQKEAHDELVVRAMCDAYVTLNRTDLECDRSTFAKEVWDFWKPNRKVSVRVGIFDEALKAALKEANITSERLPEGLSLSGWLDAFSKQEGGSAAQIRGEKDSTEGSDSK